MKRLLVCLFVAACPASAFACINDNELPSHEREFRSQYRDSLVEYGRPPARSDGSRVFWLMTGGGVVLLAGGVGAALVGGRARG
jgi:hypothetical protein